MRIIGRQTGFSLFELIGVMTMVAILSATGLQQYSATVQSFKKIEALQKVKSDVRRAKMESLALGGRGTLMVDSGLNGYRMGIDYLPFGSTPAIERQLFASSFDDRILVSLSGPLIFDSRGFLITTGGVPTTRTFTLSWDGAQYCDGTIYSSGIVEATCDHE